MSYDPGEDLGSVRKQIEVQTDDPAGLVVNLEITAEVVAELLLSANRVDFPALAADGGGLAQVRLEGRAGQPVQVTGIDNTGAGYLSVRIETLGPRVLLHLTLDAARVPAGLTRKTEWLRIHTSNRNAGKLEIQVNWSLQAAAPAASASAQTPASSSPFIN